MYQSCLKRGMGKAQEQAKLAVECGYWTLLRYDPRLAQEGKILFKWILKNQIGINMMNI